MTRNLVSILAMLGGVVFMVTPALADGRIYVPLPDVSEYRGDDARYFLRQVIGAVVVGANCPQADFPEEKWSLLNDTADLLAYDQLDLSVSQYDDEIFGPAFDALDESGTCEKVTPKIDQIADHLIALGGSLEPYPDQAAAYKEWTARQERWDNR